MTKTAKLTLIAALAFAGFLLNYGYAALTGHLYGFEFPYGTMFFNSKHMFSDFYNNYFGWNYSAEYIAQHSKLSITSFENLVLFMFSRIRPDWLAFQIYIFAFLLPFWALLWNRLKIPSPAARLCAAAVLGLFSYPLLFTIDRGNDQLYYFFFMWAFIAAYAGKRYTLAGIIFGISLGFKPFQIVFAALFIADRKYRELLYAAVAFTAIQTAAAALLPIFGSLNSALPHAPVSAAKSYHADYVISNSGFMFGHSLFGALKVLIMHFYNTLFYSIDLDKLIDFLAKPYFVFAAAVYFFCAAIIVKYEMSLWRRTTLLIICMTALPFVSADYRLLLYYIPLFYFADAPASKNDRLYCILFALLLMPKNYYFKIFAFVPPDTGLGITVTPCIMLYFAFRIIKEAINTSKQSA